MKNDIELFSFRTVEEIKVAIRPWIRIDGVLNRKVLDRMLGAVLSYCMLHPGLTMAKMQSRFIPVLQPFHTRELVEVRFIDCLYTCKLISQYFQILKKLAPLDLILDISTSEFLQLIDKK